MPMSTMTPIATNRANFNKENHTETWPKVTAKAISPENATNIQNMIYFLSWQRRH